MELKKGSIYLPKEGKKGPVKYLCICADAGDTEIMAIDGIQRGYRAKKYTFATVITSDGLSLERAGKLAKATDRKVNTTKNREQKAAAEIGRYNSVYFLSHKTDEILDQENEDIVNEYLEIIKELKPRIIYTHSILDRDPTHVSVAVKVINALRKLRKGQMPAVLYGCEMWRDLDWVDPSKVISFDVSHNIRLQKQLINVHQSQNASRDFINATIGRRYVNATYSRSEKKKDAKLTARAINMTTLLRRKEYPIKRFAMSFVDDLYTSINDSMDRSL